MAKPLVTVALNEADISALAKQLLVFDDKVKKKVVVDAMFAGGKVCLEAAKLLVPVRKGELRRSLGIVRFSKGDGIGARVLARRKGFPGGYYAHLVERGHVNVMVTRNKKKVEIGHSPAQPFMRPAVENNKEKIIQAIKDESGRGVLKAMGKGK
jgi:HK97 gp10 family phage protein